MYVNEYWCNNNLYLTLIILKSIKCFITEFIDEIKGAIWFPISSYDVLAWFNHLKYKSVNLIYKKIDDGITKTKF